MVCHRVTSLPTNELNTAKALFEVYCGLDLLESLIQLGNELFYISPAQLILVQHFLMGVVRQSIGSIFFFFFFFFFLVEYRQPYSRLLLWPHFLESLIQYEKCNCSISLPLNSIFLVQHFLMSVVRQPSAPPPIPIMSVTRSQR